MSSDGSWFDPLFEMFDQFLVAAFGYLPTLLSAIAVLRVSVGAWRLVSRMADVLIPASGRDGTGQANSEGGRHFGA